MRRVTGCTAGLAATLLLWTLIGAGVLLAIWLVTR